MLGEGDPEAPWTGEIEHKIFTGSVGEDAACTLALFSMLMTSSSSDNRLDQAWVLETCAVVHASDWHFVVRNEDDYSTVAPVWLLNWICILAGLLVYWV